jgi:Urocanase Rossmann-like domain
MSSAAPLLNDSPQLRTLRAFTLLHHLRPDWRGSLILNLGLDPQGTAVALASNIAGAVCLSLEQDPAIARQALRSGACDFVVNTLDEALRAMKNEVRQHKPLSVGLQGNQSEILDEIFERGVAPQLVTGLVDPAALQKFQTQGAIVFTDVEAATLLASIAEENHWTAQDFLHPTPSALKSFDLQAADLLSPEDTLRRAWLAAAPRLFPRETPPHRVLWLASSEAEQLHKKP